MAKKKKRTSLRKKFRISIINEETYDEVNWWRLSAVNIVIFLFVMFTVVGGGTAAIIVFTPVKQYIPGYPDAVFSNIHLQLFLKAHRVYSNSMGQHHDKESTDYMNPEWAKDKDSFSIMSP